VGYDGDDAEEKIRFEDSKEEELKGERKKYFKIRVVKLITDYSLFIYIIFTSGFISIPNFSFTLFFISIARL
jgi:hypothetical protein